MTQEIPLNMLDKLELRTDIILPNALDKLSKSYQHYGIRDKNYRDCHLFRDEKHNQIVTIKLNPVFSNASACSFELNPTKFNNISEVQNLIGLISTNDMIIKRIDYAVDIPEPIENIRNTIRAKYKKCRFDYREKDYLTGFELGSGLEVVSIYDKGFEKLSRRKYKSIKDIPKNTLTRIEVRHRGKRVPFRRYEDLYEYLNINPFSTLEFYKMDENQIKTDYQNYKAINLIQEINRTGFHGAFKKNNQNNNFKRDYKFLNRDTELESFIFNTYQNNLKQYFGV
jgi:hypothetical protein